MKLTLLLAISISILSFSASGQSDILTSKYIFNPMFFNPANTGINDDLELTYLMKSGVRLDQDGIPNKEILSVSTPIKGERWRVGVSAMHQDFSSLNYLIIKPSAAYYIGFNGGASTLSLGLATSFTKLRVDEMPFTPVIPKQNKYYSNLDLGIFYKNRFGYLGLSGRDLINRQITVVDIDGEETPLFTLDKYLALSGGINCFRLMSDMLVIRPSASLTRVISGYFIGTPIFTTEYNLEVEVYDRLNLGISYRDNYIYSDRYIDVWLGYKDHEKKFMLVTNWNIMQPAFRSRFTAELLFGYKLTYKERPIKMQYHFF